MIIFFLLKKQPARKLTVQNSSSKITQSATVHCLTLFHTSGHLLQSILIDFHKGMTTCSHSFQQWENQPPLKTLSKSMFPQWYQNPKQDLNLKSHSILNSLSTESIFICKLFSYCSSTHAHIQVSQLNRSTYVKILTLSTGWSHKCLVFQQPNVSSSKTTKSILVNTLKLLIISGVLYVPRKGHLL